MNSVTAGQSELNVARVTDKQCTNSASSRDLLKFISRLGRHIKYLTGTMQTCITCFHTDSQFFSGKCSSINVSSYNVGCVVDLMSCDFVVRYYKKFTIPDLDRLNLRLEQKHIKVAHANNTLIVTVRMRLWHYCALQ